MLRNMLSGNRNVKQRFEDSEIIEYARLQQWYWARFFMST
jgi:hypothetical protein